MHVLVSNTLTLVVQLPSVDYTRQRGKMEGMKEISRKVLSMTDINRALDILDRLYKHYNKRGEASTTPHEQAYFAQKCVDISVVRKILWELI